MSFLDLCENGSFLDSKFNQSVEGFIMGPNSYSNQLNKPQRIALGILFFFLSAVSIVANALVLFTIYKRKLQILYKCCVISQSVSDLVMAVFVGINSLNNFMQDTIDWKFGEFMCGFMPYVTTWSALLSSMILTCIALDRYQGIFLLAGKWNPQLSTVLLIIACLWMAAAGSSIPTFQSYRLKEACFINFAANTSDVAHLCIANKNRNSTYFVTIFTLIFLPLLIAFLVLYGAIARMMWLKRKTSKGDQRSVSACTVDTEVASQCGQDGKPRMTGTGAGAGGTPSQITRGQKKVRTFTIILIIMGTFIVCRLPQWIFLVVTTFPGYRLTGNPWWIVKYLLSALSLANTTINPFIYPFLNEMMRLKSNLASGLKNLKNLKLKNIRMNLVPSSSKGE